MSRSPSLPTRPSRLRPSESMFLECLTDASISSTREYSSSFSKSDEIARLGSGKEKEATVQELLCPYHARDNGIHPFNLSITPPLVRMTRRFLRRDPICRRGYHTRPQTQPPQILLRFLSLHKFEWLINLPSSQFLEALTV
jgi:hypothetical protein